MGTTKKISLKIKGMNCTACAMKIDFDLEDQKGVKSAKTNFAKSETTVEFDPKQVTEKEIVEQIKKSGYEAAAKKV